MKHNVIPIALVVAEAFVAPWAVIGDVALVTAAIPFIKTSVLDTHPVQGMEGKNGSRRSAFPLFDRCVRRE